MNNNTTERNNVNPSHTEQLNNIHDDINFSQGVIEVMQELCNTGDGYPKNLEHVLTEAHDRLNRVHEMVEAFPRS